MNFLKMAKAKKLEITRDMLTGKYRTTDEAAALTGVPKWALMKWRTIFREEVKERYGLKHL